MRAYGQNCRLCIGVLRLAREPSVLLAPRRAVSPAVRQGERPWRIPACATDKLHLAVDHAYHGVVKTGEDRAIVAEQGIGDAALDQAGPCGAIVHLNRLLAQVAARHDEGVDAVHAALGHEEVLERCVGEHDAELGKVERDRVGECGRGWRVVAAHVLASLQQHDGPDTPAQEIALFWSYVAQGTRDVEVACHDGERLVAAPLARAELPNGAFGIGSARKMESAEPLDRHDAVAGDELGAAGDDGVAGFTCSAHERFAPAPFLPGDVRSAGKAGIGLRVKPAVERVGVLACTCRAHGEGAHGGLHAVVGEAADDGEARAAVGAVDKRVMVPVVRRVEELAQAVIAGGDIG